MRMTRKRLDEIKRSYHMDLPAAGGQRVGPGVAYGRHIYIENLVEEVEACWRSIRRMSKKLRSCRPSKVAWRKTP